MRKSGHWMFERSIDRGTPIRRSRPFEQPRIFSDLIALHLDDLAQAMRQAEICRIEWSDVDMTKRTVTIRDRKDPRCKDGNHQIVPLLNSTDYAAWQIMLEQRILTRGLGRVFPYHSKSVGAAFRRSCNAIDIDDLCFHDLRHEGTSRLFEAGFSIQQVAMVTGHKDWRMLQRYTNLKPEDLHKMQTAAQPSLEQFLATLAAS